jgi:hypothetical protein
MSSSAAASNEHLCSSRRLMLLLARFFPLNAPSLRVRFEIL